jgi:hypothetical protein
MLSDSESLELNSVVSGVCSYQSVIYMEDHRTDSLWSRDHFFCTKSCHGQSEQNIEQVRIVRRHDIEQ